MKKINYEVLGICCSQRMSALLAEQSALRHYGARKGQFSHGQLVLIKARIVPNRGIHLLHATLCNRYL